MPERVSPTDRIRGHIDELFAQDKSLPEILEEVARLGAQLLMQAALEAEITEFLGRDRYQRATACEDARPGSRNGCREVTVKTTAGPVTLARPKLRYQRGVRVPAVRQPRHQDQRAGVHGDRLVRAACPSATWRPSWPRRSATRPRSPSPRCRRSAARSRTSTRPGPGAAWTR
jgi:hypothetical protein